MLNFFINYAQIRAHFCYLVVFFFAPAYMQYALTNNIYKLLALCFFSQKRFSIKLKLRYKRTRVFVAFLNNRNFSVHNKSDIVLADKY